MSCDQSHRIKIVLSEVYYYKVILLHGEIEEKLCEKDCVDIEINEKCVKSEIFNKSFKCLIGIDEGENEIKLKYCNAKKVIKFKYKKKNEINFDIQPLYIIPRDHDGRFQSHGDDNSVETAMKKINLAMELVACVIGSKFIEAGSENGESFVLNTCQIFNSSLTVDHVQSINQFELYDAIADELLGNYGSEIFKTRKFVAFVSCTKFLGLDEDEDYNYVNVRSKTLANPALGNGFLALLGTGCLYSWPSRLEKVQEAFQCKKIVDTKFLLDDSNYRKTYSGNFATSFGSLIHEMGHIFDLGHTQTGIMGNDFDYINRFFICENYTEIMPKRTISSCQQQNPQKSQNLLSNRLTKIKKSGENYLEKYRQQKNNDMTFFEPNCMLTLMNHRWFTQDKHEAFINFDDVEKSISANDEILMVEVRELDSLLRHFWDLKVNNTNKFQFPTDFRINNTIIFIITKSGSILKRKV